MLDHAEFVRWLEASDDEGRLARELVRLEAFNAVVLHAEQAAQLVLKGLLRAAGAAQQAWGHALAELGRRAHQHAGLQLSEELVGRLAVLERDYKPSRYPDALVSGTPRGNYSQQDADRGLQTLAEVRSAVVEAWDALVEQEARGTADKGPQEKDA